MASTRVYIGRLPYKARERDVEDFFRGFGRIREVLLKSGFGFVEFDDPRDADDAVYSLNGRELCGERVIVEMTKRPPKGRDAYRSTYRSSRYSGRSPERRRRDREEKYGPPAQTPWRCIVHNLSSRVSWQDLKDFMRQAGEVTYADAHRAARNEGVVCFTSHSELKKAIDTLDGKVLNGRKIKLTDGSRGRSRSYSSSRSKSSGSRSSYSRSSSSVSRSRSPPSARRRSSSRSVSRSSSERDFKRRKRSRSPSRSESQSPQRSVSREATPAKKRKEKSRSPSREGSWKEKKRAASETMDMAADNARSPNGSDSADKENRMESKGRVEGKDGTDLQEARRSSSWSDRSERGSSVEVEEEDERNVGGDSPGNQRDVQMDSRSPTPPPRSSRGSKESSKRSGGERGRSPSKEKKSKGKGSAKKSKKSATTRKSTAVAEPVMTRSKAARKRRESESDSAGKRSNKNGLDRSGESSSEKGSFSQSGSESDSAGEYDNRVSSKKRRS